MGRGGRGEEVGGRREGGGRHCMYNVTTSVWICRLWLCEPKFILGIENVALGMGMWMRYGYVDEVLCHCI